MLLECILFNLVIFIRLFKTVKVFHIYNCLFSTNMYQINISVVFIYVSQSKQNKTNIGDI